MNSRALVVGGGVVGCLTALALAERGWQVTLADQGRVGEESSWAGGGILFPLLPWNYSESVNRLALAGAARYPALCQQLLQETGIDPQYQVSGLRILPKFDTDTALLWCQLHNVTAEIKNQSLWLPQVAQARNPRLMQALRAFLLKRGVEILEHITLAPLPTKNGHLSAWQSLDGRRFEADAFVLTAGAWSSNLLGAQALSLPFKPMRGQMLLYKLAPDVLQNMLYCEDFYLIPRRDGYILAGSTVEDVGFDKTTTAEAARHLAVRAAELLPALIKAPIIKHWSGLRPGSPDNVPVIARHPQFDNLYINTGHFRYGVTMAPASAQLLGALIAGEKPFADVSAYAFPQQGVASASSSV
ncbi:MAG: glycine oxidase ThiO [Methylophilaceae bacterium]|nr:glycine oxidase ThiO [Methylophilaceae bacterium]